MKKLMLLFIFSLGNAQEKDSGVHVSNNNSVTITSPAHVVRKSYPSPKHPRVVEAHARIAQQQMDDDFVTCCCFFKIKKIK